MYVQGVMLSFYGRRLKVAVRLATLRLRVIAILVNITSSDLFVMLSKDSWYDLYHLSSRPSVPVLEVPHKSSFLVLPPRYIRSIFLFICEKWSDFVLSTQRPTQRR